MLDLGFPKICQSFTFQPKIHFYLNCTSINQFCNFSFVPSVAPIIEQRQDAMAAVVENKIYVIGGYHGNTFLPTCEALDLDKNEWNFMASLSSPRYQAGVAVLNRKIYVCGGWSENGVVTASVECYDIATDSWAMAMPLPTPAAARTTFVNFPRKMIEKLWLKDIKRSGSEEQLAQPTKKDSFGADHSLYGTTY